MAIINRDLDVSQQRFDYQERFANVGISQILPLALFPFPGTVQSVRFGAYGLSGAPIYSFFVDRFIAGTGFTSIPIGISGYLPSVMGTSGINGFSGLAAAGSTLLNFQAGDLLYAVSSVANTAASHIISSVVVKQTQDYLSMWSV